MRPHVTLEERKHYDHKQSLWIGLLQKYQQLTPKKNIPPLLSSSFVYANKIKVNKSWHRRWALLNKLFIHLAAAFSFDLTQVCRVWALMHLKQCEVNEDWRSCPASLFVFFDCGFYSNHHNNSFNNQMCCIGMAAIRQVQNDALLNLQQRVRWMCLFITDHAQHQLLQRLICHLYSPRWTTVGCFCLWFFFLFFFFCSL